MSSGKSDPTISKNVENLASSVESLKQTLNSILLKSNKSFSDFKVEKSSAECFKDGFNAVGDAKTALSLENTLKDLDQSREILKYLSRCNPNVGNYVNKLNEMTSEISGSIEEFVNENGSCLQSESGGLKGFSAMTQLTPFPSEELLNDRNFSVSSSSINEKLQSSSFNLYIDDTLICLINGIISNFHYLKHRFKWKNE